MAERKLILILANSVRTKNKYCVAGKTVTRNGDGTFEIGNQWIRLTSSDGDGAVPHAQTLCPAPRQIQPLDIIEVQLRETCNNPDHPEDWYYEPTHPWKIITQWNKNCLPSIVDTSAMLWHEGVFSNAVAAGFVRKMKSHPFSICLIAAPPKMDFCYWKKTYHDNETGQEKVKFVRDLSFSLGGIYHEFSVTDPVFMNPIWKKMTEMPQIMRIADTSNYFLCLSLALEFHSRHYKICATIFEP